MMKLRVDGFILALLLVIILAYLFPQGAAYRGGDPLEVISAIGISLIFFFYGLKLSFAEIGSGLKNWRLHLFVQATTFLLFPLLILVFKQIGRASWGKSVACSCRRIVKKKE